MDDATPIKMSELREGSLGRLDSHEVGIPVYLRAVLRPDSGGAGPFEVITNVATRVCVGRSILSHVPVSGSVPSRNSKA